MDKTSDFLADEDLPKARVALLLKHFSRLDDDRQPWRIVYPLSEVLLLLTCATIASCDDFDEIAAWGKYHLDLLRKFAPYYNGIPCERWLRALVNRINPETFASCFEDWIHALWPGRHILIAIDGKTSRRTHDKRKGLKALHTLSAYATNAHLTLAQLSVPEKTDEITAIPVLLDHLAEKEQLEGALVTIDAMGCQVEIAAKRPASPPPDRAAIGASRACTGCSMWSSRTTCRATALATAPKTWPSSAASRSASCAPTNPKGASKPGANQRVGIPSSSSKYCR